MIETLLKLTGLALQLIGAVTVLFGIGMVVLMWFDTRGRDK